jgi:hypothetical protein
MPEANTTCGCSAGMIAAPGPPDTRLKSQLVSIGSEHESGDRDTGERRWGGAIDLERAAWLVTVCGLLVGMMILLFKREWGYGGVTGAVALSAAINLL